MFGSALVSAQSYIRILSIHNATRERERESHPTKYPQRPRSPALKLQPAPSYGNSPDMQLRSEATALEHRSTLAHIQQPTIAQNDSNPGMSYSIPNRAQPVRVSSSFLG
jgi:hypothetical protein